MMRIRAIVLFVTLLATLNEAVAQVVAPDFTCIKDDTLFWNPATNTCGPFQSVDIYKGSTRQGPYSLLASINSPTDTWFVDSDLAPSYYYLQANHLCGGQTLLSSDTLSNQFQQLVTEIEYVTVVGNNVEISWYDNGSPQTIGYVIYRITPQGTLPIDTVFGTLTYTDTEAAPATQSESYYVLGLNACGGTNTFAPLPHRTIHLTASTFFCERHIQLTWNNYEDWTNGVDNNQIWLGIDGTPLAFEHRISGSDTLAYITGIIDQSEYCIAIISEESSRSTTTSSNMVCVISDVLSPVTTLDIKNVSIDATNTVIVDYEMNTNADLQSLELYRGGEPTALMKIQDGSIPPSQPNLQVSDATAPVQAEAVFYQWQAVDDCDTLVTSNLFSTVHLELISAQEGENILAWTPLQISNREVRQYEICRIIQGVEESIMSVDTNQRTFTDLIGVDQRAETICYVIKARHTDLVGSDLREARSNLICAEQKVELYIPNAFVPEGVNKTFKPEFLNLPRGSYRLAVFNRWGGQVFESTSPDIGWDGVQEGFEAPAGVYLYTITYDQPDGSSEVRSGSITLLR